MTTKCCKHLQPLRYILFLPTDSNLIWGRIDDIELTIALSSMVLISVLSVEPSSIKSYRDELEIVEFDPGCPR